MRLNMNIHVMFSILRDENKNMFDNTQKTVDRLGVDMPNNLLNLANEAKKAIHKKI